MDRPAHAKPDSDRARSAVRLVLKEYRELLRDYLVDERRLVDWDCRDRLLSGQSIFSDLIPVVQRRNLLYGPNGKRLPHAAYELMDLNEAVRRFWLEHGPAMVAHVQEFDDELPVVVRPLLGPNVKTLAVYFDTVVIEDPFELTSSARDLDEFYGDDTEAQVLDRWTGALQDYLFTFQILCTTLDTESQYLPFVVFPRTALFPQNGDAGAHVEAERSRVDAETDRAGEILLPDLIAAIAPSESCASYAELVDFIYSAQESVIESVAGTLQSAGSAHFEELLPQTGTFGTAILSDAIRRHRLSLSRTYLLAYCAAELETTRQAMLLEQAAAGLGAVIGSTGPAVPKTVRLMKHQQQQIGHSIGASVDQIVVAALHRPEVSWLESVPLKAMVQLREAGKMEEVRAVFRTSRRRLVDASLEQFDRVAQTVVQDLSRQLDEEGCRLGRERDDYIRRFGVDALSFGTNLGFGLATALMPALSPLAVPAAILSALGGLKSAKDLIDMHFQRQHRIQGLSNRPVSVLLAVRNEHAA